MYQPFSFTKQFSVEHIYNAIRDFYYPGITLDEFSERVENRHGGRYVVLRDMFISTYLSNGAEYVLEDSLIRETLMRPLSPTHARLYLFALILNMPGPNRRLSAEAQNDFVRNHLYQNNGWLMSELNATSIQQWAVQNVSLNSDRSSRKYATNFNNYFEQCGFVTNGTVIDTRRESWVPIALRLAFERREVLSPYIDREDLISFAMGSEIYKLMGVDRDWFLSLLNGAIELYFSRELDAFTPIEIPREASPQVIENINQRRQIQVNRIERRGTNKTQIHSWYNRTCQICRSPLHENATRLISEAAHIRPLGNPHNGLDHVENMISLCPNHHRQFDRGGIEINPDTFEVIAKNGTSPAHLQVLYVHPEHQINREHFRYHSKIPR